MGTILNTEKFLNWSISVDFQPFLSFIFATSKEDPAMASIKSNPIANGLASWPNKTPALVDLTNKGEVEGFKRVWGASDTPGVSEWARSILAMIQRGCILASISSPISLSNTHRYTLLIIPDCFGCFC